MALNDHEAHKVAAEVAMAALEGGATKLVGSAASKELAAKHGESDGAYISAMIKVIVATLQGK